MCWKRIKNYFKKKPKPVDLAELRWKSKRWFKRIFRLVSTKRPGPNMPKYQFCPDCHAGSPRGAKTGGGAYYTCHTHGQFFVKFPGIPFEAIAKGG